MISRKAWVFWPLFLTVFVADCATKQVAVEHLSPPGTPHDVLDDVFRLTLTYNDGAAMGLPVGGSTTILLGLISLVGASIVFAWYVRVSRDRKLYPAALALVFAGALGNGWERLFLTRGVVDFIDVGWGTYRFYTFNVADACITIGAVVLALLLWLEGRETPTPSPRDGAA